MDKKCPCFFNSFYQVVWCIGRPTGIQYPRHPGGVGDGVVSKSGVSRCFKESSPVGKDIQVKTLG